MTSKTVTKLVDDYADGQSTVRAQDKADHWIVTYR